MLGQEDFTIDELLHDEDRLRVLWSKLDANANGLVNLGELKDSIRCVPGFRRFKNAAALKSAFKQTVRKHGEEDGYLRREQFAIVAESSG